MQEEKKKIDVEKNILITQEKMGVGNEKPMDEKIKVSDTEPIGTRNSDTTHPVVRCGVTRESEFRERGHSENPKAIFLEPRQQALNQKRLAFLKKAQRRKCEKCTVSGGKGL